MLTLNNRGSEVGRAFVHTIKEYSCEHAVALRNAHSVRTTDIAI